MDQYLVITFLIVACSLVMLVTGWWRCVYRPFHISPKKMTVEQLGLKVQGAANIDRVNTILGSFVGGFNKMISSCTFRACEDFCDCQPSLYQPFAQEGIAMGYILRHGLRFNAERFEKTIVKPRPEFRYLHYIGLGFWSGMSHQQPQRLHKLVEGLDPLHRYLCFDGYGFKRAFFHYQKSGSAAFDILSGFDGYARNAAYQGVGRAFYFLYMDEPDLLIENIGQLGEYAVDAAAGMGLAAAFVNPDRLEVAMELAAKFPADWQPYVHLGLCFGLKARAINNVEQFARDMSRLSDDVQCAVFSSIRECDRVELLVRSENDCDGYQAWRQRVMDWMSENISYPLQGIMTDSENISEPRVSTRADVRASSRQVGI